MEKVRRLKIPSEIAALLSALQLGKRNMEPLQALKEDQWRSLLEFCDTAHLTLVLAQLPTENFPVWLADRLKRNLADNALRYENIRSIYQEAATALDRAGIPHIIIKGFTQAPGYVACPELRSQSDLDFVCPPNHIPAARVALEEIGYRSHKTTNTALADHDDALTRLGDWQWRGNPYDPVMPLGIELHFCLWNSTVSRLAIPEIESFWDRRTRRKIDEFSFACLSPVDHLGHLALHILRNLLLSDWIIHHVYELAVFLHSQAEEDAFWSDRLVSHSPSLRSLEALACYHARAWFGCRLHSNVEQEIARLPASQLGWLERFSGSSLENMFHQNKDVLWLHLSLLSSREDKWKIFRRILIPPRIASPDSPIVRVRNKRSLQSTAGPVRQYLAYLVSRSRTHSIATIATLYQGVVWWISRYRLPRSNRSGLPPSLPSKELQNRQP